jgi:shikimate 5-dehydrogenase
MNSTSEFKVTIFAQFLGMVMVSLGLVNPGDSDSVVQAVVVGVGGLATAITSALYIYGRAKIKTAQVTPKVVEVEQPVVA